MNKRVQLLLVLSSFLGVMYSSSNPLGEGGDKRDLDTSAASSTGSLFSPPQPPLVCKETGPKRQRVTRPTLTVLIAVPQANESGVRTPLSSIGEGPEIPEEIEGGGLRGSISPQEPQQSHAPLLAHQSFDAERLSVHPAGDANPLIAAAAPAPGDSSAVQGPSVGHQSAPPAATAAQAQEPVEKAWQPGDLPESSQLRGPEARGGLALGVQGGIEPQVNVGPNIKPTKLEAQFDGVAGDHGDDWDSLAGLFGGAGDGDSQSGRSSCFSSSDFETGSVEGAQENVLPGSSSNRPSGSEALPLAESSEENRASLQGQPAPTASGDEVTRGSEGLLASGSSKPKTPESLGQRFDRDRAASFEKLTFRDGVSGLSFSAAALVVWFGLQGLKYRAHQQSSLSKGIPVSDFKTYLTERVRSMKKTEWARLVVALAAAGLGGTALHHIFVSGRPAVAS